MGTVRQERWALAWKEEHCLADEVVCKHLLCLAGIVEAGIAVAGSLHSTAAVAADCTAGNSWHDRQLHPAGMVAAGTAGSIQLHQAHRSHSLAADHILAVLAVHELGHLGAQSCPLQR